MRFRTPLHQGKEKYVGTPQNTRMLQTMNTHLARLERIFQEASLLEGELALLKAKGFVQSQTLALLFFLWVSLLLTCLRRLCVSLVWIHQRQSTNRQCAVCRSFEPPIVPSM